MEKIQAKEFVAHNQIAKNIVIELENVLPKIEKNCIKTIEDYKTQLNALRGIFNLEQISSYAKKIDSIKENLIYNLSLRSKISCLIQKNKERNVFLEKVIKENQITGFDFSAKQLSKIIADENITITEEQANINAENNNMSKAYFNGNLLSLKSEELDFSIKSNLLVAQTIDEKELLLLLSKFPKSITTLSGESLTDLKLKLKFLKNIIILVDRLVREKSFYEINEFFGKPLNVSKEDKLDIKAYIGELENYFDAKIVQFLERNYPNQNKFIKQKLKVNYNSKFLPSSLKDIPNIENIVDELIENDIFKLLGIDEI